MSDQSESSGLPTRDGQGSGDSSSEPLPAEAHIWAHRRYQNRGIIRDVLLEFDRGNQEEAWLDWLREHRVLSPWVGVPCPGPAGSRQFFRYALGIYPGDFVANAHGVADGSEGAVAAVFYNEVSRRWYYTDRSARIAWRSVQPNTAEEAMARADEYLSGTRWMLLPGRVGLPPLLLEEEQL